MRQGIFGPLFNLGGYAAIATGRSAHVVVVTVAACALGLGATQAAAQAPYEPNDTRASATSLTARGPVSAAIETDEDVDLFAFYVTQSGAQIRFNVTNTTPADPKSLFCVAGQVQDASGDPFGSGGDLGDGFFGLCPGETDPFAHSFKPGKYYLRFQRGFNTATGVRYSFSPVGGFADAATLKSLCDRNGRKLKRTKKKLRATRRKLKRARERGSSRDVRRAKTSIKRAKRDVRTAERSVKRYCVAS